MKSAKQNINSTSRRLLSTLIVLFIAAMSVLTMTGCASSTQRLHAPIPQSLTKPCPPLAPLSDGSGRAVALKLVEVSELYYECVDRHAAVVEVAQ